MTMAAGFALFLDAVHQLWQRRAEVLPILTVPIGVWALLEFASLIGLYGSVWVSIFYAIASCLIPAWVAVFWHRYILLNETPSGILPPWQNSLVFPYILGGLLIAIMVLLIASIVILPILVVASLIFEAVGTESIIFLVAGAGALFYYLFLRFGLILPHLALGRGRLDFGESWRRTSGMGVGLWVITILNAVAFFLPALLPSTGAGAGFFLITLISTLMIVIGTLIGISILTRLYDYAGLMALEYGETI